MKKIVFCLLMLLSLGASTKLFAQNDFAQQRQQALKSYLKDSLNLSSTQIDSVTSIRSQYQPQMRTIFMDQSASASDKQTKMQAMRTQIEARYKAAGINDDAIQKMRDHDERMMAQMRNRMNSGNQ